MAADVGILIAGNGVYDIKHMLAGNKARARGKARAPLERCEALYSRMGSAFAEAYDGIDRRDYKAGKVNAAEAAALARSCADALAKAGVAPSPCVGYKLVTLVPWRVGLITVVADSL